MSTDIWNPWHGCRKCSAGCQNCYMFALDKSRDHPEWSGQVFRTKSFGLPLKKNRQKQFKISPGLRLRVNMTSDTFIEDAEPWLPEFCCDFLAADQTAGTHYAISSTGLGPGLSQRQPEYHNRKPGKFR